MPVQPMKAIAAAAITETNPLTVAQIMAGGLSTALVLFLLGVTGLIRVMDRLVPLPVVRGIQLSQGLGFAVTAVKYILKDQDIASGKATGERPWLGFDSKLLALIAFCFLVLVTGSGGGMMERCGLGYRNRSTTDDLEEALHEEDAGQDARIGGELQCAYQGRNDFGSENRKILIAVPTALLVFLLGIVLAFIKKPHIFKELKFGPSTPRFVHISAEDWKIGFERAAVPQLPLSILNSVLAVCKLSNDLFPNKELVSPVRVSVSVGLMNLLGCWIGVLPVCHGAGGLAGQYRFGARSGISVVFLGAGKLVIGLLLGNSLLQILAQFPIALLGVLLLFSGVELAMACRDQSSRLNSFVMLTCVVVSQASGLALGCICGIILYLLLKLREVDFTSWKSRLPGFVHRGSFEKLDASSYEQCSTS
ncbi:hypothetical protein O6H91_03G132100 [Diphasiastrum complanatum]|nr:hypothetical protein O6H91_03G132100 [Diphasiastrum complanatum]